MLEVVERYDVDGIHFDYIRYPGTRGCYCEGCRKRFESSIGRRVQKWPKDCISGSLQEEYRRWRRDRITRLVATVSKEARRLKPRVKVSAAVFADYPACTVSVAQDWVLWVRNGYLDFVCPMDYTSNDDRFRELVSKQLEFVGGRVPVYPGIGAWRLTPDRVVGQIEIARGLGAQGFTVFNLSEESAGTLLPAIRCGVGRRKAVAPHKQQSWRR
ncbi:MAG TPA: hypothetical protein EYP14_12750 [Planctomycetaceae bacterium]|nr:hypothetical protein [Planctomycetaceae bacterium]